MPPPAPKKTENEGLGCGGWVALGVIVLIAACYFGNAHGWDNHSFPIPVPAFSGPSDDEVKKSLSVNGINVEEVADRWESVESQGESGVRKTTKLYPVRVKYRSASNKDTLDLYFYYDDFARLHFFTKQANEQTSP